MLGTSFYYGLRLFSYKHYVGSVLHVYNMLRELMNFQEIPLLEKLSMTFADILFPGGRPIRRFKASYMRFSGGRLRFNVKGSHHRSGSHDMAIPAHAAKATAGFGLEADSRFPYQKISLLHHIKDRGYHVDHAIWQQIDAKVDQGSGKGNRRPCAHHHIDQNISSGCSDHRLCHLEKAMLAEVTGKFPTARINFFKVYMACVRIINAISDHAHGEKDQGSTCLCFLDTIILAADRYTENDRKQPFGYKDLVVSCEDAMVSVLGDGTLGDFLWKGI